MPPLTTLLVANRGEVAMRIFRAAAELGLRTVAVHSADDATCLHTRRADEARAFLAELPRGAPIVLKAVAGGGGRGLRVVADADGLADAYLRCRSEAQAAFGDGALYVERYLPRARHVEVQIIGDQAGGV